MFKAGDKVKRIKSHGISFKKDKAYTIIATQRFGSYVIIEGIRDSWRSSNFELFVDKSKYKRNLPEWF
jgi:hypothetical protein